MKEMIDVIDEKERVIDTLSREFVIKHRLLHLGIWLFVRNSEGRILIHQRSQNKAAHAAKWDVKISGLVSSGETPENACIREALEEFGIKGIQPVFIRKLPYSSNDYKDITYAYSIVYDGDLKPDPEEVQGYGWVNMDELEKIMKKRDFMPSAIKILKELRGMLG